MIDINHHSHGLYFIYIRATGRPWESGDGGGGWGGGAPDGWVNETDKRMDPV